MKKSKLYNTRGSTMILVIVCMAIIMIVITMISSQNINQIKSTSNNKDVQSYKYAAEAGIDKVIAEACNQIEEKVKITSLSTKQEYSNDKDYVVTNKLKIILAEVQKINDQTTNKLELELEKIIEKSHTEEQLIKDLIYVKEIALETSGELCYENIYFRSTIYDIIKKINEVLEISYLYEHKNHTPMKFIDKTYPNSSAVNENNKLISQLCDINNAYSYNVYDIVNKQIKSAQNSIMNAKNAIGGYPYNNIANYINDTIIYAGLNKINTDYITGGVSPPPGNKGSVRGTMIQLKDVLNASKLPSSKEFLNQIDVVCGTIDNVITNINNVEQQLYELYTEQQYAGNGSSAKYPIDKIRPYALESIKQLDIAKYNLIETKCRLKTIDMPSTEGEAGNTVKGTYVIDIKSEKYDLDENTVYYIENIYKEIPVIYNEYSSIIGIEDVKLDIISTGSNKNKSKTYKIKSTVVIKSRIEGSAIKTSYEVLSHEKI